MKSKLLRTFKRGRICTIAKLVLAQPLNEWVIAMPYRNRRGGKTVSLPLALLDYAKAHGVRLWVVRLDKLARCYALPLAQVEKAGWLQGGEWYVSVDRFTEIPWQAWPYVDAADAVTLGGSRRPEVGPVAEQAGLF